jgi:hypothetical protein
MEHFLATVHTEFRYKYLHLGELSFHCRIQVKVSLIALAAGIFINESYLLNGICGSCTEEQCNSNNPNCKHPLTQAQPRLTST